MPIQLPYEILLRVASLYFEVIPRNVTNFLLTNSTFFDIGQCVLHENLRFRSRQQMLEMRNSTKLAYAPQTISIKLAGGASDFTIFKLLYSLIQHIMDITPHKSEGKRQLLLQHVQLCLNSYMLDPNSEYIYQALTLMNPYRFVWTGPDPAHHFSIAKQIVPKAAVHLFGAIQSWTNLKHLKLTNIAFPVDKMGLFAQGLGVSPYIAIMFRAYPSSHLNVLPLHQYHEQSAAPSLHANDAIGNLTFDHAPLPHLETVYVGQVTFLRPAEVAMIALEPRLQALIQVRVVDAYGGNIWGPRVRIGNVEDALVSALRRGTSTDGVSSDFVEVEEVVLNGYLERIRKLVSCEALTERIIGGDRMDTS